MNFYNSSVFSNMNKRKLSELIEKYKDKIININDLENCKDRDELLYCFNVFKWQQKKEVTDLNEIMKKLSFA